MAADSNDEVALAPEHRRYLDDLYARLDEMTAYEMLGVGREADDAEIKRAYFKLVRIIHPDRYYKKNLGPYRPKLEAVFARLKKVYETLSQPAERAKYDARLSEAGIVPTQAAPKTAPVTPAEAARKQAVLDALKQRVVEGRAKAQALVDTATRAEKAGDLTAAADAYRRALELSPNDAALKTAHASIVKRVAERRCDAHRRQAALAEQQGRWVQAAASWQHVIEALPEDRDARAGLARAQAAMKKP